MFVLGVGAQKAGTSWLHWYLQQAPNADCGALKEYHVWDARLLPEARARRVDAAQAARVPAQALRRRMQTDPEAYFDYFATCLQRPGISVTGDITPLYGALPAGAIAQIAEGFERRGIACRVVFLMRDPVARCRSHAAMLFARGKPLPALGIVPERDGFAALLEALYQSPDAQMRTRYDHTIAQLETALPAQDLYLGIYEEMFDPAPLERLSRFCDVPCRPELTRRVVRQGGGGGAIPEGLARDMARHFAPVYDACQARWPQVRQLWPGFADL